MNSSRNDSAKNELPDRGAPPGMEVISGMTVISLGGLMMPDWIVSVMGARLWFGWTFILISAVAVNVVERMVSMSVVEWCWM